MDSAEWDSHYCGIDLNVGRADTLLEMDYRRYEFERDDNEVFVSLFATEIHLPWAEHEALYDRFFEQGARMGLVSRYRFIATDRFPDSWIDTAYNLKHGLDPNTKNTDKNYDRLGVLISDARLAGLIDWNVIEDRHRHLEDRNHWESPSEIIDAVARQYPSWA